jgi:hypothetical protein
MVMQELYLGLPELDNLIQGLEQKYGISTASFVSGGEESLPDIEEDDIFKWEAYVSLRSELLRVNNEVTSDYLAQLKVRASKSPTPEDQLLLAA